MEEGFEQVATEFTEKIKLAIVDDHEMFRIGIKVILSKRKEMEVILEASNGKEFIDQLQYIKPNIVLLDISMPVMDGYATARKIAKDFPDIHIIVLSMFSEEQYYYKMIEAGAKGFILKKSGIEELTRSIIEVAKGNNYFAQDLLRKVVFKINNKEIDNRFQLSEKEKDVLYNICQGFTNHEIAEKLFLSSKSIERYRTGLIQKTQTRNTAHLVMYAIVNNLIEL